MAKKNIDTPICAVDFAFRRIGGKYKGRILWYLHIHKVLRYGELRKSIIDITTKMLTQTLRELEEDGLVHREVYHTMPPRVEYTLTPSSQELIPFINHLRQWGDRQMDKENIPKIGSAADCVIKDAY
ncbi:helix-turn-helix transcriptional regulator [Chitinophaga filiformis]|uniref:winged helix-turn-helix transcriptional regulator n=1 Tax=Chitinophaga filiformis TaxID=104663 RepID=UPI001F25E7C9|nr:helix-turn-helix domain-containing protein [Chitinophaga filiformis]MCF6404987.1 helix-turn-helix transcriptional regulator [Chitinophaga filiformis]